jgi:hypothetical protein
MNVVDVLSVAIRRNLSPSSHSNLCESEYLLRDAPVVVIERYILFLQDGQDAVWIVFVHLAVAVLCNMKYILQDLITLWLVKKINTLHAIHRFSASFATSDHYGEFERSPYPQTLLLKRFFLIIYPSTLRSCQRYFSSLFHKNISYSHNNALFSSFFLT